ncbi:hypothetical protein RHSIM_Rhsim04G0156700 [Rhododendron simsii]|uniref:protein-serine/threonine phosphatase n=1 Tax=Rhododendron simsii TaxID=118357 RepID=A0A834LNY9_RHOSS|nr:hypothetical protein RHSIM_Rhsim04G0156700 [Rhododendron simsii]
MGNGVGKLNLCFACDAGVISRRHDFSIYLSDPLDEGLGHSFCYFRSDPAHSFPDKTTPFKSISGASLSANTSTPLSTAPFQPNSSVDKASSFDSSESFASIPLQPIPRNSSPAVRSGPILRTPGLGFGSGPIERGFLSGPIERSFFSGPFENQCDQIQRYKPNSKKWGLMKNLKKALRKSLPMNKKGNTEVGCDNNNRLSIEGSLVDDCCDESLENTNVQWAQGKAGEDRVHIAISEESGWVFVGIYDGFNGPDATDFLLNNLYANVHEELQKLLTNNSKTESEHERELMLEGDELIGHHHAVDKSLPGEDYPRIVVEGSNEDCNSRRKRRRKSRNRTGGAGKKWEESNKWKWKCECDGERLELDGMLKDDGAAGVNHSEVLKALSEAMRKTEASFLEIADLMLKENPELSLMGSCVLVMLMKGEDVYLMNVGDSRAVLARKAEADLGIGKARKDLERINEETLNDYLPTFDCNGLDDGGANLASIQLTTDHSTSVAAEVKRIKKQHQDDASAITNDRVKGSLKVTRAFGAGYLKQPKWNNALLEVFRVDYVGNSPYITCSPSLYHHRLSSKDRFLILSSDGLYQYFTNEEATSQVEMFISSFPEGDPAQHLVEEVLFRAAKRAGMDFHELLDIPQGDRRRYHDDVSIIIISFEGRIWRSSV